MFTFQSKTFAKNLPVLIISFTYSNSVKGIQLFVMGKQKRRQRERERLQINKSDTLLMHMPSHSEATKPLVFTQSSIYLFYSSSTIINNVKSSSSSRTGRGGGVRTKKDIHFGSQGSFVKLLFFYTTFCHVILH